MNNLSICIPADFPEEFGVIKIDANKTKTLREFYEVKSVLESYAARLSVKRITDAQIDRMEFLNKQLRKCYERSDVSAMVPVHNEFHETFVKACGNDRLSSIIHSLVNQFQRFRIALSHTDAVEESIKEHEEIVAAFRARDEERVCTLVAGNSSRGGELLISNLKAA